MVRESVLLARPGYIGSCAKNRQQWVDTETNRSLCSSQAAGSLTNTLFVCLCCLSCTGLSPQTTQQEVSMIQSRTRQQDIVRLSRGLVAPRSLPCASIHTCVALCGSASLYSVCFWRAVAKRLHTPCRRLQRTRNLTRTARASPLPIPIPPPKTGCQR